VDPWAEIRQLDAEGKTSRREIARRVGVSRGTVERALAADQPPRYERPPRGSSFDVFAPRVRALLVKTPPRPASTLAERVDWSGSSSLFRAKVALIRPEYVPPDPADRLVHSPGAQVQCDWGSLPARSAWGRVPARSDPVGPRPGRQAARAGGGPSRLRGNDVDVRRIRASVDAAAWADT
jgi:transposase